MSSDLSVFDLELLQRARFWNKKFSLCQNVNYMFYHVSDFDKQLLKVLVLKSLFQTRVGFRIEFFTLCPNFS